MVDLKYSKQSKRLGLVIFLFMAIGMFCGINGISKIVNYREPYTFVIILTFVGLLIGNLAASFLKPFMKSNNGDVSGNHGDNDSWIVKLDAESGLKEIDKIKLSIFPNPTSGKLIKTSVYEEAGKLYCITDVLGNIVSQGIINSISVELDITLFDSGVYYIYTENANATKLVKL